MSTLLAVPPQGEILPVTAKYFLANGEFAKPARQYRRNFTLANGSTVSSLRFEGVPVFRSGMFRDSWGDLTEWTSIHTSEMVQHFDFLKSQGIFVDVPVRKGHGSFLSEPLDTVIGYVTGLGVRNMTSPVDNKQYSYVLADYDVIDPEGQQKIESGLWRNRSAEVGTFVTNNEASYTPVFMGFAYVDVPAVEGLNGAFSKLNPDFAIERGPKEHRNMTMSTADGTSAPDGTDTQNSFTAPPPAPVPPTPGNPDDAVGTPGGAAVTQPDQDAPEVDEQKQPTLDPNNPPPIQAPVGAPGSVEVPVLTPTPTPHSEEVEGPPEVTENEIGPIGIYVEPEEEDPSVTPAKKPGEPGLNVTEVSQGPIFAKWNGNHFTIGGRKMSPEAGADLINQYQAANVAAFQKEKKDRVTALAKSDRIMATSLEKTLEYAAKLNRTQFKEWISLEEAKPPLPLFARQASPTQAQAESAKVKEYEVHKEVVAQLRVTKNEGIVKASNAWKKGTALASELNLPWE